MNEIMPTPDESRTVLRVSGEDSRDFLQNLVTNDIGKLSLGLTYAALLTPQGKYLFDFFMLEDGDDVLLDIQSAAASDFLRRLTMYRLRASVCVKKTDIVVARGIGKKPNNALADPRHPVLGWRLYGSIVRPVATVDWDELRVSHCIPETGIELIQDRSYILEVGFERLNGVDFKKGCYVGQEVTARMKHKTELRKQLKTVAVDGYTEVGTDITENARIVGTLYSQSGGKGLAHLRLDRIKGNRFEAGSATVSLL